MNGDVKSQLSEVVSSGRCATGAAAIGTGAAAIGTGAATTGAPVVLIEVLDNNTSAKDWIPAPDIAALLAGSAPR